MKIILLFLILLSSTFADISIDNSKQKITNFELRYIYDETNKLNIDNISNKKFTNTIDSQYTFGYVDGTTWFKITITNNSDNEDLILYNTEPFAQTFNLYRKINSKYVKTKAGLNINIDDREIFDSNPVFDIKLLKGERKTYYIQTRSEFSTMGEFILEDKTGFYTKTKPLTTTIYMFYFGSLVLVIFLNYFLFFSTKNKIYFYYSGYILFFTMWILMFSGYDIYLSMQSWHAELNSIFATSFMIFFILFSKAYLEIEKYFDKLNKLIFGYIGILIALIPLSALSIQPWLEIINFFATISFVTLIIIALLTWRKGVTQAKYYLFVMLIYLTTLAITSSVITGNIQNNNFSRYIFLYASYFEVVFFTLILAKIHNRVQFQANTDSLTGLLNRRYFNELANRDINLAKKHSQDLCVFMIDIDCFKNINDTYGHKVGDKVLVQLASILAQSARCEDITARYGGEDFMMLLPSTSIEDAANIAHAIKQTVEDTVMVIDSNKLNITLSIGVAQFQADIHHSLDDLLSNADYKLYKAKEDGRNLVCSI